MATVNAPVATRLRAMVGVVAISFSAILVVAAGVSPGTAAFFRGAYALPAVAAVWWFVRGRDARPARERWLALAGGVFLGIDLNLWHRAIDHVGAGLATVLGNTQVIFVALIAWMVHRERPTLAALAAVPVALVGVVLVSGLGRADAYGSEPVLGAIFGVLTALAYTGYLLLLRAGTMGRGHPAGPILDATFGTAAASLVIGWLTDPGFSLAWSWPAHGWLILLGVGAHSVGWLSIATALPRLPALDTSVLLLVQPCLTVVWGVVLFAEAPSVFQWAGLALVLLGVGAVSVAGAARRADAVEGLDALEARPEPFDAPAE